MRVPLVLLSLGFFGCEAAVASVDDGEDTDGGMDLGPASGPADDGAAGGEAEDVDGDDPAVGGDGDGGDGGDGVDGGGVESEPEPEPVVELASGDWVPSAVALVEDTCGFDDLLRDYLRIPDGTVAFLPGGFDVEMGDGLFEIEAQRFGAQGAIQCGLEGEAFSCETQSVDPEAYDLSRLGWEYAVDFTGVVIDEETIEGRAVVAFPEVDRGTASALAYAGLDIGDCIQVVDLVLVRD